ncbi:hypothetical protein FXF51_13645 [Nonomuraea sp. PA05]|uniref:hypothetical protein n=1 Tax=Nonomuraea sp. PA05 TaxID=2604466 RepID=UPI0011D5BE72|nr:hypothetical protein [Nonomuraea sp. PA05]TYB67809.1 hypothetical protein FXF51_13645 [Nonomuraea sp. PA05]
MAGSGRLAGLVLLALGPVLAAAYAGAGHVAVRAAVRAQLAGPGWQGGGVDESGLTSLGVDTWRLTWWTAAVVGLAAVAYLVFGVLLQRERRGRTLILVVSGVLIVPYALGFGVALFNPVVLLANLYESPDFLAGLPAWQPYTAWLLLAGGLAQAVGMVLAAAQGKRAAAADMAPVEQAEPSLPPVDEQR